MLAVLLIIGIAYAATRGDDDSPTTSAAGTHSTPTTSTPSTTEQTTPTTTQTSPTTTSPTTTTVTVDPAAYLDRPVKDVEKELKDLGLEPVRGDDVPGGEKDTVADISPTGEVPEGTQVTLAVYTGDEGDNQGSGNTDEHGNGPKPSKPKEN